jgi:hypothetical protein
LAVDGAGNVFVADGEGYVIELPQTGGGIGAPVTVASQATLGSNFVPVGVAIDVSGNIYVADLKDQQVLKLTLQPAGGYVSSPIATTANFGANFYPEDVVVDGGGNVYVTDSGDGILAEIPWNGSIYGTPVTLLSSATTGMPNFEPYGVALDDSGSIYVADPYENSLWTVPWSGSAFGTPEKLASADVGGVVVDDKGNVFYTDNSYNVLVMLDRADPPALSFGTAADGTETAAQSVTVNNIGNTGLSFSNIVTTEAVLDSTNTCTTTSAVSEGGSCTLAIDFAPTTVGNPVSGTVVLTDNAANSPQTVTLTGTGLSVLPTVTGINPSTGLTTGGAQVTITGTNFTGATAVDFGSSPAASLTIPSPTTIIATAPSGSAGTVDVTVTTPGGTSGTSSADQFTYVSTFSTTLTLGANPATSTYGQQVTLSATLTPYAEHGLSTDGEMVTFFSGTTSLGTATLTSGVATLNTTALPAGTDSLSAHYLGDSSFGVSSGSVNSYVVGQATATINVTGYTVIYNGNAHTATSTVTGIGGVALPASDLTLTGTTHTAAGSYTNDSWSFQDASGNYIAANGTVTDTINQAALTATANNAFMLYGSTPQGLTGTLTGVVPGDGISASYTTTATSSSPAGTYQITPELNDPNGKHGNYTITLNDATLTVEDFSLTGGATATVMPGGTATYIVQFAPAGSSTFFNPVTLTLTGQPASASYKITPLVIPSGSGTTAVAVTVNTATTSASSSSPKGGIGFPKPLLMAIFIPLLGTRKLSRALRVQIKTSALLLVMLGVLMVGGMTACGNGSGFFSQAPQTYPMILTGTSGGLHNSVTLNLTVQ